MPRHSLTRRAALSGAISVAATSAGRAAPDYPRQTVRLIVGFPPGGGADLVARAITPKLSQIFGQPCVVENRPGADGRIGADFVVRAKPDGYTILISTEGAMVIAPHVGQPTSYKPLVDLAPVSLLTRTQTMLVATPGLHVATLADVIRMAKEKPGALYYASSGVGGPNHLAAEVFRSMAGIDIVHVPFKGSGAAIPAVLSGEVPLMFGYVPALAPFVHSKTLIGIAVGGAQRSPALPDVPTIAEAGVPGYRMESWVAALAPAKTPAPILDKLQEAIVQTIHDPDVAKALSNQGFEPVGGTAAELGGFLVTEDQKYTALLQTFVLK